MPGLFYFHALYKTPLRLPAHTYGYPLLYIHKILHTEKAANGFV